MSVLLYANVLQQTELEIPKAPLCTYKVLLVNSSAWESTVAAHCGGPVLEAGVSPYKKGGQCLLHLVLQKKHDTWISMSRGFRRWQASHEGDQSSNSGCLAGPHSKQLPLVHQIHLPLLQLQAQPLQLLLVLAQERAVIHILIHCGCIADLLCPRSKLQGAHRLCTVDST